MLREGMPVDASDERDWTALHVATMSNRTDVVKLLLNEGADANRQHRFTKVTPLHLAAQDNSNEVARLLIGNGADINIKNGNNKAPLDVALKGTEVERLLLQLQQSAP